MPAWWEQRDLQWRWPYRRAFEMGSCPPAGRQGWRRGCAGERPTQTEADRWQVSKERAGRAVGLIRVKVHEEEQ